ncbi:MAG: glycoside hydrolase family 2 TIM barrel-domain containing protein [Parvibaculum sp.]|nr:glycoside hydrolase family 2 TIM barrel-domain containing protein [Parvibaculum sp.]
MKRLSINDGWTFTQQGKSKAVTLPHTWNNLDGQDGGNDYYRGLCAYERVLKLDADPVPGLYLEFEAANAVAEVFVNGMSVGAHKGGYSTFRMDISAVAKRGEANSVRVEVNNSAFDDIYPLFADFTFMGGLYRDAHLIITNPVRIDLDDEGSSGVYVSQKKVSAAHADLSVDVLLTNASGIETTVECVLELIDAVGAGVAGATTRVCFSDHSRQTLKLSLDNPHLWQGIEDPYLYSLSVRLLADGIEIDRRDIPTGLRFFEVTPDKGFFLNGKPWRLNGVCRHQCREDTGWALSPAHMYDDMRIIQQVGANAIRLAHYQHNDYFYELCDRAGLVVWAEIPYISITSSTDTSGANALSQMSELVKQNYNHSSIVFWGIQNSVTFGGFDNNLRGIVQSLNDLAKTLDPYRLTTQAQASNLPDEDAMNLVSDVTAYNKYFGWSYSDIGGLDRWLTSFAENHPDVTLGISEYGCEAVLAYHTDTPQRSDYTEEYQALYHEGTLDIFSRHQKLWGTFVWNMFDFASDFRDEGGVKGRNNKGIVTHDHRTRKDSFYIFQAHWSKKPMLHITSKRYAKRTGDTFRVKVYSNEPDVTLFVDGKEFASQHSTGKVFTFDNVPLHAATHIEAKSAHCSDCATFEHVKKAEPSYICPKVEDEVLRARRQLAH